MGRRRSRTNQFLEPNLYFARTDGLYRYKHPITGKYRSLGRDKANAVEAARLLNARLMNPDLEMDKLVEFVATSTEAKTLTYGRNLGSLIDEYIERHVPEKRWADQTRKNELANLHRERKALGQHLLTKCSTLVISQWLDGLESRAAYTKHRTRLIDVFAYGVSRGLLSDNPAEKTLARSWSARDKLRKRLTLEAFQQIHTAAPDWFKVTMELALTTLQRRSDLVRMRYTDIREDGSSKPRLYVAQEKTHRDSDAAFIAIRITPTLEAIIERSKDGVKSPFIIHRMPDRKIRRGKEHWSQVLPRIVSDTFSNLRDELGLYADLEPEERPTFHEIRSLGVHLYEQRLGKDEAYTQRLAGHTKRKMTDEYAKGHEVRYEPVDADMDLAELLDQPKLI